MLFHTAVCLPLGLIASRSDIHRPGGGSVRVSAFYAVNCILSPGQIVAKAVDAGYWARQPGAEGLSGLAKVFLYAGGRAPAGLALAGGLCCGNGDHHALVQGDGWYCGDRPRRGATPFDAGADEHIRQTLLCPSPVLGALRSRW